MAWIESHVWLTLAGAVLGALILGSLIAWFMTRRNFRKPMDRAFLERDVAYAELAQAKGEMDSLYAALRKRQDSAEAREEEFRGELESRASRIEILESELDAARRGQPYTAPAEPVATASVPEPQPAIAPAEPDPEMIDLIERNRFLATRIGSMEETIEALNQKLSEAEATGDLFEPDATPEPVDTAKTQFLMAFLKQRVAGLEQLVLSQPQPATVSDRSPEQVEGDDTETEPSPRDKELMARLRWRNRYLEGRLAYFEEKKAATKLPPEPVEHPSDILLRLLDELDATGIHPKPTHSPRKNRA